MPSTFEYVYKSSGFFYFFKLKKYLKKVNYTRYGLLKIPIVKGPDLRAQLKDVDSESSYNLCPLTKFNFSGKKLETTVAPSTSTTKHICKRNFIG